jgi:hypothetical protein
LQNQTPHLHHKNEIPQEFNEDVIAFTRQYPTGCENGMSQNIRCCTHNGEDEVFKPSESGHSTVDSVVCDSRHSIRLITRLCTILTKRSGLLLEGGNHGLFPFNLLLELFSFS